MAVGVATVFDLRRHDLLGSVPYGIHIFIKDAAVRHLKPDLSYWTLKAAFVRAHAWDSDRG